VFLAALGCRYVIVGHSERRMLHGETDEQIAAKTTAAVRSGLFPVICVGETAEDLVVQSPSAVPVAQLSAALSGIRADDVVVVAYEPVWAIGSGQPATPAQAEEVCAALRGVVGDVLGEAAAERTQILYGGSVAASNITGYLSQPNVDGALVGGASLKLDAFAAIVRP
jgi:triosephosphate isomerase